MTAVRIWILLSSWLVASGWVLSALRQLNRLGYTIAFAIGAIIAFFWWRKSRSSSTGPRFGVRRWIKRFKRPAPFLFLLLAFLSLVSGVLHAPYNSDTYAYRLPRVLHWLGQEQWHWIHTADARMNIAGCGYEWLAAPLILFTDSDRGLFVINWFSFLLLPGLTFSALKSAGVRLRVAWWWAWVLASGWCYVLQAASVSNDSFAVVYSLAAVVLAVKSRESNKPNDFFLSVLAVALLTGVKQVNIPLVLLWAVAALPQWRLVRASPWKAVLAVVAGVIISAVPITIFNWQHTGAWSGIPAISAEYPGWQMKLDTPFWGVVGNAFCLPLQNLVPPFFPWSNEWNRAMDIFVTTSFGSHFQSFENFGRLSPGVSESSAGIGLAIVLLAAVSIFAARRLGSGGVAMQKTRFQWMLAGLPWLLLIVFMAEVGDRQNARHLSAYYVFFFPLLLSGAGHERLIKSNWWRRTALGCIAVAAGLLVINPSRPLFPARTIIAKLLTIRPESRAISLLQNVYSAPDLLADTRHWVETHVPADEPLVGYAGIVNAKLEPGLWLPLGSRRVARITATDTREQLLASGIRYVVIEEAPSLAVRNLDDWRAIYHATLIASTSFRKEGSRNNVCQVYVLRLEPPGKPAPPT